MQKDLTVGVLNEIYGKFLTARQSEIVSQYYDYDLSLQEISENLGISRQAVLDAVKEGSEQLYRFEKELKVLSMRSSVRRAVSDIENGRMESALDELNDIISKE